MCREEDTRRAKWNDFKRHTNTLTFTKIDTDRITIHVSNVLVRVAEENAV